MAKSAQLILISALIFSPLAFGTVEHWSLWAVELLAAAAAGLYFCDAWFFRRSNLQVPGLAPLLLLLALMVLQIIPLPPIVVKILSPQGYGAYLPVLDLAEQGQWLPLSINQKATVQELLRISAYSLIYILTIQLLRTGQALKLTIDTVVFLSLGIALLAILQKFSSPDKIYWFRAVPDNASPFGPWINPNQFSGYIEMLSPLALALFLFYKPRIRSGASWRERFISLFTQPGSNRYFYYGFGSVLLVLAVFVSLCRGGIISVTLAAMAFIILHSTKKLQRARLTLALMVCFAFLAVSWFGWDIVLAEFNHGFDSEGQIRDGRTTLWADSLRIVGDFPLLGTGFGTFEFIYPGYKSLPGDSIFDHAHNDYLELLTDGGVVGFLLASWFVCAVLLHGWKMVRARRDQYAVLVGIGALSGLFAMLMHSVTDFNMHNGAVGLYFFFICGVLVAAVNVRYTYSEQSSLLKNMAQPSAFWLMLLASSFLIAATVIQAGVAMGRQQYNEVRKVYLSGRLAADRLRGLSQRLEMAMRYDPLEGLYPFTMGTVQWFLGDRDKAQFHYLQAAMDSPMEGAYLQRLGFFLTDDRKGGELIDTGYRRAQNKDELAISMAEWLLIKGRREEAGGVLKERLLAQPELLGRVLPLIEQYSFSREEIELILPPTVESWLHYAGIRENMGDNAGAALSIGRALDLLARAEQPKPQWYQQIINFYRAQQQDQRALEVLRQAVERLPGQASFHIQMGEYYEKEGIVYRAKEEYERALILDPASQSAKSRLRRLGFADSY
jgi:O-antigen ligase